MCLVPRIIIDEMDNSAIYTEDRAHIAQSLGDYDSAKELYLEAGIYYDVADRWRNGNLYLSPLEKDYVAIEIKKWEKLQHFASERAKGMIELIKKLLFLEYYSPNIERWRTEWSKL